MEVLDVTFTNSTSKSWVNNWHVSEEPSCSDHRHIRFRLGTTSQNVIEYRSKKATDWGKYLSSLRGAYVNKMYRVDTAWKLEQSADKLTGSLTAAFEQSCPLKRRNLRGDTTWWSDKLSKLRKRVRKLFNRASKSGVWETYSEALATYKKEIKIAKQKSFKGFCEDVANTSSCCRLHKALGSVKNKPIGTLIGVNGMTKSDVETAKVLIQTHFPGATIIQDERPTVWIDSTINAEREDWRLAKKICKTEAVKWAISTFKPFKAGGEDGIFPALLQKGANEIAPSLAKIYAASVALGYIPQMWRKVNVLHLHKPGKKEADPKAFRPISLMSFMLKGLEKIVERHIRDRLLGERALHANQHAYQQGKSTETALSALVDRIEQAIDEKEICLIAFLDIEGAFNNTTYEAIRKALNRFQIETTISRWIMNMLNSRIIKTQVGEAVITASVARGCPQGGVLSPLLWSMVVDDLIRLIRKQGVEAIGYADDIAVIVRGGDEKRLCAKLQETIDRIQDWCTNQNLAINPKKTIVIPFTKRRKLNNLKQLSVLGEKVEFSNEIKYLGVILDSKLNWKPQMDRIVHKATMALWTCKRMCGRNWGMRPIWLYRLYILIVRPIITYGAVVWWKKTTEITTRKRLDRLQRMASLLISGCMSTTPGDALAALLGLHPLHLVIKYKAEMCLHRLYHYGYPLMIRGHKTLITEMLRKTEFTTKVDIIPPRYISGRRYKTEVQTRLDWEVERYIPKSTDIVWYTDGSKTELGTGCGIVGPSIEISHHLGQLCTVFQAEIMAVNLCSREILKRSYKRKNIIIFCDSQAAIKALNSTVIRTELILETVELLEKISANNWVSLNWIPAHEGHSGNERADLLAKKGTGLTVLGAEPYLGVSRAHFQLEAKKRLSDKSNSLWANVAGKNCCKTFLPKPNPKISKCLLGSSRHTVRTLIGIMTGHCLLNKHMKAIGLSNTSLCRFCGIDEETSIHIIAICPAFSRTRMCIMNKAQLDITHLAEMGIENLRLFLKATRVENIL